jgi:hypothetical protein
MQRDVLSKYLNASIRLAGVSQDSFKKAHPQDLPVNLFPSSPLSAKSPWMVEASKRSCDRRDFVKMKSPPETLKSSGKEFSNEMKKESRDHLRARISYFSPMLSLPFPRKVFQFGIADIPHQNRCRSSPWSA